MGGVRVWVPPLEYHAPDQESSPDASVGVPENGEAGSRSPWFERQQRGGCEITRILLTLPDASGSLPLGHTTTGQGGKGEMGRRGYATLPAGNTRSLRGPLGLCVLVLFAASAHGSALHAAGLPAAQRPAEWAVPLERPGLPNLFQVSPVLYRGAQPKKEGIPELERMGIKTVVSLRVFHDDSHLLGDTSLSSEVIPLHTWHLEEEDAVRFLRIVTDPTKTPVFVHCRRGIDRTGTMVAVYRMAVQGWTREDAIREMTQGGFGYDDKFPTFIRYLRKVDIPSIKRRAGLGP